MRRMVVVALLLASVFITPAQGSGALFLTEPIHRTVDGLFINDDLAKLISPTGELGIDVYRNLRGATSLYIDMALIEEVEDLANGYVFLDESGEEITIDKSEDARRWLDAIILAAKNKRVFALPYGNPSRQTLADLAPAEYHFYKELAQSRLSGFLGRTVEAAESKPADGTGLSKTTRRFYSQYKSELRKIYAFAPAPEIVRLRLELGKLMNPEIPKGAITTLSEPLEKKIEEIRNGVRVASGNYTITSAKYDLPLTVINDYSVPIAVQVKVRPSNSRILIGPLSKVSVPANSQTQVELPIEVIASGETSLEIELRSTSGKIVGENVVIPLRLAVISPVATWFTTGMAMILLLAAVIQSMRRVKRRRLK